MPKIGLALSGGGFRGTLYHLGVIRFLRDARILPDVTHITSVSGGSILAAHLVLNWDRYNGTDQEFDQAAREVIDFVQLDVRNRIVRRFPFFGLVFALRWITRRSFDRRYTRTGLLENYYKKHLYGDTCLYELPAHPELHILSTNLSEGCICSFTRSGLIMQRRLPGDRVQFERIQAGLAPVPLAVAASSAFPGFFPPMRVRAADIGASEAAFSIQTFTDGGVFDNLGVRAFRFIERCWSEECRPTDALGREMEVESLGNDDDAQDVEVATDSAEPRRTPMALTHAGESSGKDEENSTRRELVRRADLHRQGGQTSAMLGPPGPEPGSRGDDEANGFHSAFSGRGRDRSAGSGNRPKSAADFDAVLVSDAGAQLSTHRDAFGGGVIRTAMRASDILMDRVWQLEKETFGATAGFLFASIHQVVEREEDPHAPLPVVQREVLHIRTDLDRFSRPEIRSLVKHGYCVTRRACRSRPDLFGDILPDGPPWDPYPSEERQPDPPPGRPDRPPAKPTLLARELQQSAFRHVISTLVDWRDGMTYLFLPLLISLVLAFPVLGIWSYIHISRDGQAMRAIAGSNLDEARIIELVRDGPVRSMAGLPVREVDRLEPPDFRGFVILSDGHIVDLRRTEPLLPVLSSRGAGIYQYRHFLVRRIEAPGADDHLRFQFIAKASAFTFRCRNEALHPVLKRMRLGTDASPGDGVWYRLELDLDFSRVPVGATVDVVADGLLEEPARTTGEEAHRDSHASPILPHNSYGDTKVATMWILLPDRRRDGRLELMAFPTQKPREKRTVLPTRQFESLGGALLGWQIIGPEADTTYEGHWLID